MTTKRTTPAIDVATLEKALTAWAQWYSARLDRIGKQLKQGGPHEDYTGYEQDLFEAIGCYTGETRLPR